MSTSSSANVTDVNLVLKERIHMRLCINMLIFAHNLGNWLIGTASTEASSPAQSHSACGTVSVEQSSGRQHRQAGATVDV